MDDDTRAAQEHQRELEERWLSEDSEYAEWSDSLYLGRTPKFSWSLRSRFLSLMWQLVWVWRSLVYAVSGTRTRQLSLKLVSSQDRPRKGSRYT